MGFDDVLRGLKAVFLQGDEAGDRGALLSSEATGLSADERAALLAMPVDRVRVYAGLLRETQATLLAFVAPSTLEVAETFCDCPRARFARDTLVHSPRRTARLRELAQRVVEHLEGPGRDLVRRCPPLLDLARFERATTEAFYAPDDDGAMTPDEFGTRVAAMTVEEGLTLPWRPCAAAQVVALDHDVVDWRERRFEGGAWSPPPERLPAPIEVVATRAPSDLQPRGVRVPPAMLDLVRPRDGAWRPLEGLAEGWLLATGSSGEDPEAPVRFFGTVAAWVRDGMIAVGPPGSAGGP